MKKNLGLRKNWWRWGCGSNKKDEQMDGHEVGIEIGLLEKAFVQFTVSIPLTLFVLTSGLKKEFKAKRKIDPIFPCHGGPPLEHSDEPLAKACLVVVVVVVAVGVVVVVVVVVVVIVVVVIVASCCRRGGR